MPYTGPDLEQFFTDARTAAAATIDKLRTDVLNALNTDSGGNGDGGDDGGDPPTTAAPFFINASHLWQPIPANPRLADQSSAWGALLADPAEKRLALTDSYSTCLVVIQKSDQTRRADVRLSSPYGGPNPLKNVAYPGTAPRMPKGDDGGLGVIDYGTGMVTSLWGAKWTPSGWTARAGSTMRMDGDGIEQLQRDGTSTGACIPRAVVVTRAEIAAGVIPHALFFSTNVAAKGTFWPPATKTDGSNIRGVSNPIPEGARVQLDPTIDLTKISGISRFELTIGQAFQRFGAYVGDNGGSRMSISCETADYSPFGAGGDYPGLNKIPWRGNLRVLAKPGS